ncbi:hypothetical protein, partial [Pseudomonas sp. Xaverov 259]|uniref:hypothetical protein n=1 Tax=Pseudomonas sp. Xaverov 259 TaxID=2666086 RepID=UPI001C5AA761
LRHNSLPAADFVLTDCVDTYGDRRQASSHKNLMSATHTFFEEKLQIPANIWYKVSRSERV